MADHTIKETIEYEAIEIKLKELFKPFLNILSKIAMRPKQNVLQCTEATTGAAINLTCWSVFAT